MEETMNIGGNCINKESGMCEFNINDDEDIFDKTKQIRY